MLPALTFLANLIGLATGVWLGLFLVTRSPRRSIAWLSGLTLWSLSSYFVSVLLALIPLRTPAGAARWQAPLLQLWGAGSSPDPSSTWLQGWLMIPAIVFWHHATTLMRSPRPGAWQQTRIVLGYAGAVVAAILQARLSLLLIATGGDPLYLNAVRAGPLYPLALITGVAFAAASIANLLHSARAPATAILRTQFRVLAIGTLLAGSLVSVSVAGSSLGLPVPIVIPSLLLLATMLIMGHGVARYSAFVEGRSARRDFFQSAVTSALVFGVYLALTWIGVHTLDLTPSAYILVAIVIVSTHFLVDTFRLRRDESLHQRDARYVQTNLRKLARLAGNREEVDHALSIALQSLCAAGEAIYGLIAVFEEEEAPVVAGYRWQDGTRCFAREALSADDVVHLGPGELPPPLAEAALLIPLYGGARQLGALILGRPASGIKYSPADVDQFLYVSDRLGDVIWQARQRAEYAVQVSRGTDPPPPDTVRYPEHVSVEAVEDALRHMADYAYLGRHSLACFHLVKARVASGTVTHLDVGRAISATLAEAIEKLRPGKAPSTDPPAREWYPYLVLHDAYVEGISNRDVMSRLYISQGTFNRTRRAAVRALARALEEMEDTVA